MAKGQSSGTCNSRCQLHVICDLVTLTLYRLCTWWSPKKKKKEKVNTWFPEQIVFHNRGLTVLFKSFSARVVQAMLEIKDGLFPTSTFFVYVCYHLPMLQFPGDSFHNFKYFPLFLLTNAKSISVSFPSILHVIFLCYFCFLPISPPFFLFFLPI